LNEDPEFRASFLKDPARTLKEEGLTLHPDMAKDLEAKLGNLKYPAPPVAGSSVSPEAFPDISINISKNF
jgi:hypothetical protein